MRRIFIFVMAAVAAAFAWSVLFSHNTYAADASWNGENAITYDGNQYNGPAGATTNTGLGLPTDSQAYTYLDPDSTVTNTGNTTGGGGSVRKIHVIYFASSADIAVVTTAKYKTLTYKGPDSYTSPSTPINITINKQSAASNQGTSSCNLTSAPGISWIICPVTNFLANGMDWVFNILSNFLIVRPVTTDPNTSLFRAWTYMRSFANVAFLIAFMIIIYSQLTSFGISNYGIKKLLPRLIIAALLVNLSYYICAIAVDLSNVLGSSIQGVFIGIRNSLVGTEGNTWQNGLSWASMTGFILSGGTMAGLAGIGVFTTGALYGVSGSIFLLLPALVTGLLAVLVALLIMAARQALVTVLIIIAPIAFVAYLLPNTEKWYEKWQSTFLTMLVLFPAFSAIYGGSQLAAAAIIQNADSINLVILGMLVQVAPLFITPLLIKLSGTMLGQIANFVSSPNKRIIDKTREFTTDRAQNIAARRLAETPQRHQFLRRRARQRDFGRREREGRRAANIGIADARWANDRRFSDIDQATREAADSKAVGEGRSELRYNARRTVPGRIQNLDADLRANKAQLGNVEMQADSIFKGSQRYVPIHEESYIQETEKQRVEQTLDRNLKDLIHNTPVLLRREMEVRTLTDEAATAKARIDRIHEEIKARVDTSPGHILSAQLINRSADTAIDLAVIGLATERAKVIQQELVEKAVVDSYEIQNVDVNGNEITDRNGDPLPTTELRQNARTVEAAGIDTLNDRGITRTMAVAKQSGDKRDSEDVAARVVLIESTTNTAGKIGVAATALRQALADNDVTGARAATKILMSTGAPGKMKLDDVIMSIPAGDTSDAVGAIKGDLAAGGIKNDDVVMDKWATNKFNDELSRLMSDPATYAGLTPEEWSSQTNTVLRAAYEVGGLTRAKALSVTGNGQAMLKLSDDQRIFFTEVAAGRTPPPRSDTAP